MPHTSISLIKALGIAGILAVTLIWVRPGAEQSVSFLTRVSCKAQPLPRHLLTHCRPTRGLPASTTARPRVVGWRPASLAAH